MKKSATEKMDELFDMAVQELKKNFRGEAATEKTRRAISVISVYKGLLQAEAHRDGIQYAILKDIASDKKEFKEMIGVSMPHIPTTKLIEKK